MAKTERVQVKLIFEVEVESAEPLVQQKNCAALAAEAAMEELFEVKGTYRIKPEEARCEIQFGRSTIRPPGVS